MSRSSLSLHSPLRLASPALQLLTLALSVASYAPAQTFSVIHQFTGFADGGAPFGGVVLDGAGNLYGTTWVGGQRNAGAVYQLKRSGSGYVLNPLYNFIGGIDGRMPESNVVFGRGGALYGFTNEGGYYGRGVVFSLRPQSHFSGSVLGSWAQDVLYAFRGIGSGDGTYPVYGKLVFDPAGNIYGTTQKGGANDAGTVFELSGSGDTWTYTTLHDFGATGDGSQPLHGVIFDNAGNLYGTTAGGGLYGGGTVFQLAPSASGWTENIIASFDGSNAVGGEPQAGLIMDQAGNLYGATAIGAQSDGAIFELTPSGNSWQMTVLHQFAGGNQYGVVGNLAMDAQGNLYGNTYGAGAYLEGMVFKLAPSVNGWTFTDLYDFTYGYNDGGNPSGDLAIDGQGNLYGTCQNAGGSGKGTLWKVTP